MIYEIWMGSFYEQGHGIYPAKLMDRVEAGSFQEACNKSCLNRVIGDEDPWYTGKNLFNPEDLTYWGVKLFDNEQDANRR